MSIVQPKVGKLTSSEKAFISAKFFEAGLKPNSRKNHGNNDLVSLNYGRELTSFEDCAKLFWLTFAETVKTKFWNFDYTTSRPTFTIIILFTDDGHSFPNVLSLP